MIDPIKVIKGQAVPVPGDDIDTDRIIPARYLKCVTFDGLGEALFYDERYDGEGNPKGHTIDEDKYKGAKIILSGNNFGCGSSREHAPQSIKRAGFDVVVAESFAEIFYGNSTTLGIVCAKMPKDEIAELMQLVQEKPDTEFVVDVEKRTLTANGKEYNIEMREGARSAFLDATYDSLGMLLQGKDQVAELENSLPYDFQ
ncbi:3-isopropylmalate dehydratase small subunit [Limisalsivibrio acetivorans]|uniref:3-isopropylmalate dehydratase small subunit n=1 Tax=Limisalsivibrio acetivorans TaxID=1304888 RepID=UPI0003B39C55|nr:3-isopropylmalate dehydratase small subunit [Limisalsivibrio acetivorans]